MSALAAHAPMACLSCHSSTSRLLAQNTTLAALAETRADRVKLEFILNVDADGMGQRLAECSCHQALYLEEMTSQIRQWQPWTGEIRHATSLSAFLFTRERCRVSVTRALPSSRAYRAVS